MEFRLLGPFEVVADGAPIVLRARGPRVVLAMLALRAGQVVSADALIEGIWNGRPPASAASVLRVYVTQVRRALAADRIVTKSPGYLLAALPEEVDARRFESFLADGRRALAGGNVRLARSLHSRALDLWRGDALADLAAEPFARDEAARLDDLRALCFEGRLDADLLLGEHELVLPELERLVAARPLRERLRGQLMLALYRSGRQADALATYRAGRAALVDDLGLEPSAELRELERRILDQDPSLDPPRRAEPAATRVPAPQTATIGRDRELAELRTTLLEPGTRLVTLIGPGGIGKTRLALELANDLGQSLADGAVFVDLAPLTDSAQLLPAIGTALGLRETGLAGWEELIGKHLADLEFLLLLDNFEHLVEGAAPITTLLDSAPRLTVLATSRRRLQLAAEQVVDVRPLRARAAFELLVRRTVAAGASVDEHDDFLEDVSERLEGLPLAIELAAPWLRTLPPRELLGLLDSRLDALANGKRDAPARQRTMRAVIDWSFDLLDEPAQRLLGRLSLFRGEFTTDAMLEVGGPEASVEQLARLVDASIVQSASGSHRLLDMVREYAGELPTADDEGHALHARHFVAFAAAAEGELAGPDQLLWLEGLERRHDDLRAALEWLGTHREAALELQLAASLGRFWYIRGHLSEGLERLQRAVEQDQGDDATTAKALRGASALALLRGDYVLARSLAERGLELYRSVGDDVGAVRCLSNLGAILHAQGELEVAAETLDECIAAAEGLGDGRLTALARNNRGDVALSQGDLDLAADQFTRSLALLRAANDAANVARALYNLGAVAVEQGRPEAARAFLGESLELAARVDDSEDVAWCLIALAALAAENGAANEATSLLGFTTVLLERIGATMKPFEQRLFDRTRERLGASLDRATLEQALLAGAQLPLAEAVGLGLATAR